jgi:diguanylate cyclase (GGDEF)-like protein
VAAPPRPDEAETLAALRALQILDTPPEAIFDSLVRAASLVCGAPISLVSLIDGERQWFKANLGLSASQTPREEAFCAHAVLGHELMEVPDAAADARFADNPLVVGDPGVRFYAGVPLELEGGHRVGTLCVIDRVPRRLSEHQRQVLVELGAAAAHALRGRTQANELARAVDAVVRSEAALVDAHERMALAADSGGIGIWELDLDTLKVTWDSWMHRIYGLPEEEGVDLERWRARISPRSIEDLRHAVAGAVADGLPFEIDFEVSRPDFGKRYLRSSARLRPRASGRRRLVGATWDVTESRELAADLRRQSMVNAIQAGVAIAANDDRTVEETMRVCLDLICLQARVELGHVYLTLEDTPGILISSELWTEDPTGRFEPFREETRMTSFQPGTGLVGTAAHERRAVWVKDLANSTYSRRQCALACGLEWGIAAPVLVGDEVVAVLEFLGSDPSVLDATFIELCNYAGVQLGRVVDRQRSREAQTRASEQLKEQSIIDELTGLYNRRGFMELAQLRRAAAVGAGEKVLILFADLDGMKQINDQLGHEMGDRAIRELAGVLRRSLRSSDVAARLGGDEFVACVSVPSNFDPESLLSRVRGEVEGVNVTSQLPFKLSVSVGLSEPLGGGESLQEAMKRADGAMYSDKAARRAARSRQSAAG